MSRIDPNNGPIQDPYLLLQAMLNFIDDESVAVMRQHVGQMSGSRMQNICSDVVVLRQKARNEAEFQAKIEQAEQAKREYSESRARAIAARSLVEDR